MPLNQWTLRRPSPSGRGSTGSGPAPRPDRASPRARQGMLDGDFDVTEPEELVTHLRLLADRYTRSTPPSR